MNRTWHWIATVVPILLMTACGGTGSPPPTADAGADSGAFLGEVVVLDGRGSSGDGLAYAWSFEARPSDSTAVLEDAESAVARFVPDRVGAYELTLTVTNAQGSDTDGVTIEARAPEGVSLDGASDEPAAEAVYDLDVPIDVRDALTSIDEASGLEVLRTEITIEFIDEATVGRVNALLDELDGSIVSMVRGVPTVAVRIPDPGDLASLTALLEEVRGREAVADAWWSWIEEGPPPPPSEEGEVTPEAMPPMGTARRIDHHQAVRGHAAWNARGALPSLANRPWLLIGDFFGDGVPGDGHGVQATAGDYATGAPWRHGYHVLGIVSGTYGAGATTTGRSDVNGLFPGNLRTRAVDLANTTTGTRTINRLVQRMNDIVDADADARIVVNTSIGFRNASTLPTSQVNRGARTYARLVRRNDHEGRVVHLTSAGNTDCAVNVTGVCPTGSIIRWNASVNSVYAFAALGDMRSWLGTRIDNLEGVLVVENRTNTAGAGLQRPAPACARDDSIMGGSISAIGTSVWSFGRPRTAGVANTNPNGDSQTASNSSGTSMSTPQVAGLAASVWSLDPRLSAGQVVDVLTRTSRNDYPTNVAGNAGALGCNATAPQPVIDALDAVLAAGGDAARSAMMDVADGSGAAGSDGRFDERDLELFVAAYAAAPALDYSRFDLNGDGVTDGTRGSTNTERFDLDGDEAYASLSMRYLGAPYDIRESAVSDLDILCYFGFGPLYSGSDSARNRLLGQPCGIVDVQILDPAQGDTFLEGEPVAFIVEVTFNGSHGGDVILSTGGSERARYSGYSYLDSWPITTLSTRHICPGNPTAEVAFHDASTGLRATDTVTVDIRPSAPSVSIGGPRPRHLRVYHPSGGGDPRIDAFDLSGKASDPNCRDPFSEAVDQDILSWIDPDSLLSLGRGPTLQLDGSYLDDGAGGFQDESVQLRADIDGTFDVDELELRPCTSTLGLDTGASSVEGYPECPLDAVIGGVLTGLHDAFGTFDPNDIDAIVGLHLNGEPLHRDVLEELGFEPCDPRFCDPFPPGFPHTQAELSSGFYGDRSLDLTDYLDRLFKVLASPSWDELETQMRNLRLEVAADGGLGDGDRELFAAAIGAARAALTFFGPEELGGQDQWRRLGFAGDPETLGERVDAFAPARRSVEGLLTAIVIPNDREGFGEPLHIRAAAYAGALEARRQALIAAEGGL